MDQATPYRLETEGRARIAAAQRALSSLHETQAEVERILARRRRRERATVWLQRGILAAFLFGCWLLILMAASVAWWIAVPAATFAAAVFIAVTLAAEHIGPEDQGRIQPGRRR